MIVLALIAQGCNYGLAMEEFVESARMRLWAKIGTSTIYKALKDLEADGCLTSERGEAKRGPGKKVFALTEKGRQALLRFVAEALASEESVYSDRIAGLVFSMALGPVAARPMIEGAIEGMQQAGKLIEEERAKQQGNALADIILDYYAAIYRAEQEAMRAVRSLLLNSPRREGDANE